MQEALKASAGTPRGSELLEEFLDVVPELAKLSDRVELEAKPGRPSACSPSIGNACSTTSTSTTTSSASTSCGV